MRRIVSVLFLLCFAWSQAAAAECPMAASHADRAEPASHAAHSAHGGHARHAPAPAHDHGDDAPHPAAASCVLAMSCGAAALPTPSTAGDAFVPASGRAPRAGADAYASPIHTADPPPPRRTVLA